MDARAEKIALFRYALIAPVVLEMLPHGELTRRAEEIAARKYDIPYSEGTSLSVDTLLDWVLRYRRGGFPALASPIRSGCLPRKLGIRSRLTKNHKVQRFRGC
jgi:hypothetical protein